MESVCALQFDRDFDRIAGISRVEP